MMDMIKLIDFHPILGIMKCPQRTGASVKLRENILWLLHHFTRLLSFRMRSQLKRLLMIIIRLKK